ncbi:SIMPL domain-containing protein [Zymobacter sp. IVIA_5232.4 C2]|uniref:SIMPL domain-containing protein n=1 Tax=Zymobacter sp. IVIA_5232.4 C2 TaxID=3394855 RepID=UPI0039C33DBD
MSHSRSNLLTGAVLGGLIAVGLVWSGSYLRTVGKIWQESNRIASVKGVAERELKADMALWPVYFRVEAKDLASLQVELQKSENLTRAFLRQQGFEDSELSLSPMKVSDRNEYGSSDKPIVNRYTGSAAVVVRTSKVETVRTASRHTGDLVSQGVLLSSGLYDGNDYAPQYQFTKLNDIKPDMIREATANARKAAEQFASDSESHLGAIKNASQGYFTVEDLDSYTPDIKKVRVVTNIDYTLKD